MNENRKGSDASPPAGSARARLEALQRRDRATAPIRRRMFMASAFLAVLVAGLMVFECRSRKEASWFDVYKDSAWMAREGKWEELSALIAEDLVIEGADIGGKKELLALARKYEKKGLSLHASHPYEYGENGDRRWMRYFLTWSRGNLEGRNVVPIVAQWLLHVQLKSGGEGWVVDLVIVRPTLPAPELNRDAGTSDPEGR